MFIKKYKAELVLILCSFLFSTFIFYNAKLKEFNFNEAVINTQYFRGVDSNDLVFGNPNARIFIVEYGDMQCPFCQDFHLEVEKFIKGSYGLSGDVAWVWRDGFHIDQVSIEKAETLQCVKKYDRSILNKTTWDFLKLAIEQTNEAEYPYERFEQIFELLNINSEKINECRKNNEVIDVLSKSRTDILNLNIDSTPKIQFIDRNKNLLYEYTGVLTEEQLTGLFHNLIRIEESL